MNPPATCQLPAPYKHFRDAERAVTRTERATRARERAAQGHERASTRIERAASARERASTPIERAARAHERAQLGLSVHFQLNPSVRRGPMSVQ